jgi:hypothetical protein
MLLYCHQNTGQSHHRKIRNRPFESVALLKYLGTTVTNKILFMSKLRGDNSGNACYHSAQKLLFYRFLSKNVRIEIFKTIILLLLCTGVKVLL